MSFLKALSSKDEYRVAIVSPLPIERAAATAILDERHAEPSDFSRHSIDENAYTWGRICEHNVVITSLPAGMYGVVSATTTVLGLLASLPSIKVGLLVGIGAGVPESGIDIRLGDIAVGCPELTLGGVVQYDTGKAKSGKKWERTGLLVPPSKILLHALAKLQAEHEIADSYVPSILDEAGKQSNKFAQAYKYPGIENDRLYEENPDYKSGDDSSKSEKEVVRSPRTSTWPSIYYGTIASGNTLVKDVETRRAILDAVGHPCICIEMEAAGLMDTFPCLVIRGICDYADAHKNDTWQRYASATAAAFAKELLMHLPNSEVRKAQKIESAIEQVKLGVDQINSRMEGIKLDVANDKVSRFLKALYTCPYAERKDRNTDRIEGTCDWFTRHPSFLTWFQDSNPNLLWVSAEPGCGKSVLAKHLIDEVLIAPDHLVCYFFFKEDFIDQRSSARAASALLRQLLIASPGLVQANILEKFAADGDKYIESFQDLWATFVEVSQRSGFHKVICILDALDECVSSDRKQLIDSICSIFSPGAMNTKVSILTTSRPYSDIMDAMFGWSRKFPIIHLSGDNDEERDQISEEIKIVINHRIEEFTILRGLSASDKVFLVDHFMAQPERTYLWVNLFLRSIETAPGFVRGLVRQAFESLPKTVDEAYNQILNRSPDHEMTKLILRIIVAAERPLSLEEMAIMLCLNGEQRTFEELEYCVNNRNAIMETVKGYCSLVVTITESKLYLHHQTARTFLVSEDPYDDHGQGNARTVSRNNIRESWKHSIKYHESDRCLAERCLWFLKLRSSAADGSPFLFEYCASLWAFHLNSSDIEDQRLFDLAIEMCSADGAYLQHWFPLYEGSEIIPKSTLVPLSKMGVYRAVESMLTKITKNDMHSRALSEALWWSAVFGYEDLCRLLLKHGADPNAKASGITWTSYRKRSRMATLEHQFGTSDDTTCLHESARLRNSKIMELLLDNEANINAVDATQRTALFYATQYVRAENVASLVRRGVYPAHRDLDGYTALGEMYGYRGMPNHDGKNCINILEQLIDYESDCYNIMYRIQQQAHYQYCQLCTDTLLRYAIKKRGTSELRRYKGMTLLHFAVSFNAMSILEELLKNESSWIAKRNHASKLLHHACLPLKRRYNPNLIDLLIIYGADVNYENRDKETCMHVMMYNTKIWEFHRNVSIMKLLLAKSANLDVKNWSGMTPLIYAATSDDLDDDTIVCVIWLLEHGADCTLTDNTGRTAHSWALVRNKPKTAKALEDWASSGSLKNRKADN